MKEVSCKKLDCDAGQHVFIRRTKENFRLLGGEVAGDRLPLDGALDAVHRIRFTPPPCHGGGKC